MLHGNLQVGGAEPIPGFVPTPRFNGEDCVLPPREQPYSFTEVNLHSPEYRAGLMRDKFKFHGPPCVCGSRATRFVQAGVRHCSNCGDVDFRITAEGYRGVRIRLRDDRGNLL
jgi:hypothetical protein